MRVRRTRPCRYGRGAVKWRLTNQRMIRARTKRLAHAARLWAGSHDATWDGLKKRFTAIFESEGFVRSCPEGSALLQLFSCHFIAGSEAGDIGYALHVRCQEVAGVRHKCPPSRGLGAKRPLGQRVGHFARGGAAPLATARASRLSHPRRDPMAHGWPDGIRPAATRWPPARRTGRCVIAGPDRARGHGRGAPFSGRRGSGTSRGASSATARRPGRRCRATADCRRRTSTRRGAGRGERASPR